MAEPARWTVRVSVPPVARRGEAIEVRALVGHVMETGFRHDHLGAPVPRDIITVFSCRHAGAEVFRVELSPSISARHRSSAAQSSRVNSVVCSSNARVTIKRW